MRIAGKDGMCHVRALDSREARRKESAPPSIEPPMGDTLPKQAILIVNAKSRSGADAFDGGARQADRRRDRADRRPCGQESRGDGAGGQGGAIAKAPMVIVGGGDGSLSSIVDHFVGHGHGVRPPAARHRQQLRADARHAARPRRRGRRHRQGRGAAGSTSAASTATISLNAAAIGLAPEGRGNACRMA